MKLINKLLIVCFFFLIFSITFTTSADLNQDLGRHLKIGEIIIKTGQIPDVNLFSYTNPNFPFVNHHWLSEVIFYLLTSYLGLNSLIFLKVIIFLSSFVFIIKIASKKAGVFLSVFTALAFSPLILERSGIRPEIFGYWLFSFLLYISYAYPKNKKLLFFIPLIMIFWINLHISFIFGVFFLGILIFESLFKLRVENLKPREFLIISFGVLVLLINPGGPRGLLYPLSIFSNYGYTIVENQNLFYLSKMTFNPLIKYFFLLSPLVIASLIVLIIRAKYKEFILLLVFYILAVFQIRHLPFFILIAVPTVSESLFLLKSFFFSKKWRFYQITASVSLIAIEIMFSIFFVSNVYALTFDKDESFGLGFKENGKKAAEFIQKNRLPKNILNNFDIGGYLIYKLYPAYKLFVDNRPEAYPKDFFQKIYIPAQLDQNFANGIFNRYQTQTIVFFHTDNTDWGKIFIKNVYNDLSWKLVYLDDSVVIFTRKTGLQDLRDKKGFFESLIKNENDYLNLLKTAQFFNNVGERSLVQAAVLKAKDINPSSCAIKKALFSQYQNSPYFYLGDEIKKNSWYCF